MVHVLHKFKSVEADVEYVYDAVLAFLVYNTSIPVEKGLQHAI